MCEQDWQQLDNVLSTCVSEGSLRRLRRERSGSDEHYDTKVTSSFRNSANRSERLLTSIREGLKRGHLEPLTGQCRFTRHSLALPSLRKTLSQALAGGVDRSIQLPCFYSRFERF